MKVDLIPIDFSLISSWEKMELFKELKLKIIVHIKMFPSNLPSILSQLSILMFLLAYFLYYFNCSNTLHFLSDMTQTLTLNPL